MKDKAEAIRRGQSGGTKLGTMHPYAAIEHRVLDSPAYATLTYAARAVLTILTRQLNGKNNGHLQATKSYLSRFGINNDRTISRSIKELLAHGLIYRTRCGGFHKGASQYAVTWQKITDSKDLHLGGFKHCAWRDWKPEEKNTPAKKQSSNCKNGIQPITATAPSAADHPRKSADNELVPSRVVFADDENAIPASRKVANAGVTVKLVKVFG